MKYSIGKIISKSIKENKWLSIDYVNANNEGKYSYIELGIRNKKENFLNYAKRMESRLSSKWVC